MSDCVFWSFEAHMKHLGRKVEPFAHDLFRAMRKPTLPAQQENIQRGWWDEWTGKFNVVREADEHKWWGRDIQPFDFSYTNGAVAPIILHTLASYHGLALRVQHDAFYGSETGILLATNATQQAVARSAPEHFGTPVDVIDLAPAMYLCIEGAIGKHAHFSTTVPENTNITMAFQLYDPTYETYDGKLIHALAEGA